MLDMGHKDAITPSVDAAGDDDRDASASVTDTEVTDMTRTSEVTSHGSLTSVD
jgi:hypothetical protein